jgi:hypothetical protein
MKNRLLTLLHVCTVLQGSYVTAMPRKKDQGLSLVERRARGWASKKEAAAAVKFLQVPGAAAAGTVTDTFPPLSPERLLTDLPVRSGAPDNSPQSHEKLELSPISPALAKAFDNQIVSPTDSLRRETAARAHRRAASTAAPAAGSGSPDPAAQSFTPISVRRRTLRLLNGERSPAKKINSEPNNPVTPHVARHSSSSSNSSNNAESESSSPADPGRQPGTPRAAAAAVAPLAHAAADHAAAQPSPAHPLATAANPPAGRQVTFNPIVECLAAPPTPPDSLQASPPTPPHDHFTFKRGIAVVATGIAVGLVYKNRIALKKKARAACVWAKTGINKLLKKTTTTPKHQEPVVEQLAAVPSQAEEEAATTA